MRVYVYESARVGVHMCDDEEDREEKQEKEKGEDPLIIGHVLLLSRACLQVIDPFMNMIY